MREQVILFDLKSMLLFSWSSINVSSTYKIQKKNPTCTSAYISSLKPSRKDEQDMRDSA